MVSRDGDDAVIRHILRTPKITDAEVNESINKLDSAWAKLIAGTTTFGEAVARYSEDENTKYNGGYFQNPDGTYFMEITQLDKQLVELLAKTNIKASEFTKPTEFTNESGKRAVRIVYLKTRTAPHRENIKDDYDQLAREALEVKKQKAMEAWFATRLPKYYIMIDQDFRSCSTLKNWIQYTSAEYK
jgi:peptidyl-prolyl cis-trans isomerase SurA